MSDVVRPMTAEAYFDLPETNQIDELIDGEYIVSPPPIGLHQLVVGNFYFFLRSAAPSGQAVVSPAAVRFEVDHVLEPDVFWLSPNGNCKFIDKRYWQGTPDLVIEVLSPSTAKRDSFAAPKGCRGIKFEVYERHGVREDWLVDLDAQFVEVYRHEDGMFKRQGIYSVEETFSTTALGIEVELKTFFAL